MAEKMVAESKQINAYNTKGGYILIVCFRCGLTGGNTL
jgi:hypothetical protein